MFMHLLYGILTIMEVLCTIAFRPYKYTIKLIKAYNQAYYKAFLWYAGLVKYC